MPPRARARSRTSALSRQAKPAALSEADVSQLREKLESGKKPRVMLLVDTALGPAGTSVPIVSFGDPAEGEFISVKLRDDVVPFSPAELAMPVRGWPAPTQASTLPLDASPTPAAAPARPYKPARTEDTPRDTPQATPRSARLVAVPEPPAELSEAAPAAKADPPAKSAGRKPARGGGLSVTLRFGGQSWTYESTRSGRKSAARPLNLAAVRAFTDRLDDPTLRRDMQVAIDVCRAQAQNRADALRAELERVEVELAELDE